MVSSFKALVSGSRHCSLSLLSIPLQIYLAFNPFKYKHLTRRSSFYSFAISVENLFFQKSGWFLKSGLVFDMKLYTNIFIVPEINTYSDKYCPIKIEEFVHLLLDP